MKIKDIYEIVGSILIFLGFLGCIGTPIFIIIGCCAYGDYLPYDYKIWGIVIAILVLTFDIIVLYTMIMRANKRVRENNKH